MPTGCSWNLDQIGWHVIELLLLIFNLILFLDQANFSETGPIAFYCTLTQNNFS